MAGGMVKDALDEADVPPGRQAGARRHDQVPGLRQAQRRRLEVLPGMRQQVLTRAGGWHGWLVHPCRHTGSASVRAAQPQEEGRFTTEDTENTEKRSENSRVKVRKVRSTIRKMNGSLVDSSIQSTASTQLPDFTFFSVSSVSSVVKTPAGGHARLALVAYACDDNPPRHNRSPVKIWQ